jgi:hypothetical protein
MLGSAGASGASGASSAVVIALTGSGRIVISTAMDAWRYRDDDGGTFDRFWRSVVAEGAAAGAPLRLQFEHAIGVPGSRQQFTVRYRGMTPPSTIEANAVARCGPPSPLRDFGGTSPLSQPSGVSFPRAASADRAETIRLWPTGAPGVMRGEVPIGDHGACTVDAAVNDARVTRGIAVSTATSRPADDTLAELERRARASGGAVTDEDNLGALAQQTPRSPTLMPVRPMRAAWWILPFAGCLSIEWWLRRRVGLR